MAAHIENDALLIKTFLGNEAVMNVLRKMILTEAKKKPVIEIPLLDEPMLNRLDELDTRVRNIPGDELELVNEINGVLCDKYPGYQKEVENYMKGQKKTIVEWYNAEKDPKGKLRTNIRNYIRRAADLEAYEPLIGQIISWKECLEDIPKDIQIRLKLVKKISDFAKISPIPIDGTIIDHYRKISSDWDIISTALKPARKRKDTGKGKEEEEDDEPEEFIQKKRKT